MLDQSLSEYTYKGLYLPRYTEFMKSIVSSLFKSGTEEYSKNSKDSNMGFRPVHTMINIELWVLKAWDGSRQGSIAARRSTWQAKHNTLHHCSQPMTFNKLAKQFPSDP